LYELHGYSTPLTTFLVNNWSSFHRPVLIFQPTMNSNASNNQSKQCQDLTSQLGKTCSYQVSTYISVFVEGFRRWKGYILAPERKPDLQGSCSLASHSSLPNRSEQNSSKLRHTVCDVFTSRLAI